MIFNTLKTIVLLLILSLLCMSVGSFFGPSGMKCALIMALCMNGLIYFFSDKIVLRMYNAQPLDLHDYSHIHNNVEELAYKMQIPKPSLWLIDSSQVNAFATGRNPSHASVALTTAIIDLLDQDELQGVLAHELSHVKNRDIFISTVAATIASIISYASSSLRYSAMWGSSNRKSSKSNPFMLFFIGMILPIIATLVQLAISRSREYQADETGVRVTRDPLALASALQKLESHTKQVQEERKPTPVMALGIVHPFCGRRIINLFSTHPPMHKRIERLQELHKKLF